MNALGRPVRPLPRRRWPAPQAPGATSPSATACSPAASACITASRSVGAADRARRPAATPPAMIMLIQRPQTRCADLHPQLRPPHCRGGPRGRRPTRAPSPCKLRAISAANPGPRRCASRSRSRVGSCSPSTTTASVRSHRPRRLRRVRRPPQACTSQEDHFLVECLHPQHDGARPRRPGAANWSSPPSPNRPCPSCVTAPATSRSLDHTAPAHAGAYRRRA